ncbi:MAG TPA: hypothetical protein VIV11_43110 [Kofleriaceae bacterium]
MGTTTPTLIALIVAAQVATAHAENCTGVSSAGKFALCFDPGNRISVTAGSDGFGAAVAMRHIMHFDDEPDLVWKLEHVALDATHAGFSDRFTGAIYRGYFMRHARDGHIVLPLGVPKKVFLPFDVGAYAEVGTVTWRDLPTTRIGIVNLGGMVDFARTRTFRRRLAFGPSARWDVDVMQSPRQITEHFVAPFSTAMANLRFESANGRLVGDLRAEAGLVWSTLNGWEPGARAEAFLERIMLAINDRPISLVLGARYESDTGEAIARVGARIVLFDRHDPRVSLD